MNFLRLSFARISVALLIGATCNLAVALEEITVAYFKEWPTASQVAQVERWYDKEMDVKVNWKAFESGVAISEAMARGEIQMAYSHGLVPFTLAVTQGVKIKAVGVAVSYADNDNCVVSRRSGITKTSARKLEGGRVAVARGTVSHYKLLRQLDYLDVDATKVRLIDLVPSAAAAALSRGDVQMACGWGGAYQRMLRHGDVLLSAAELEAIGIRVFDLITVTDKFGRDHPDKVSRFLSVTDKAAIYLRESPDRALPLIAQAAGMKVTDAADLMSRFHFPNRQEQLSAGWLGGGAQQFMKEVADFFVGAGQLPGALDSYHGVIDSSYYRNVR